MAIWFNKELVLQDLADLGKGTLSEHLGIEFTELGTDYIKARMPVDPRTRQPYGLLHGGASLALAETLGSIGAAMVLDTDLFICVGLEINANHIRGVRDGFVTGTARPFHMGGRTQVWEIKIEDEAGKLVCVSRITVAVLPKGTK
jgi:1,4-dihydroxy-2-naphthoyl-CoA hydrolase